MVGLICRKRGEGENRRGTSWSITARKTLKARDSEQPEGGGAVAVGDWRGEEKDGGCRGVAVSLA